MGSLDVDSILNNIPLEETIDICANTLFVYADFSWPEKKKQRERFSYIYKLKFLLLN